MRKFVTAVEEHFRRYPSERTPIERFVDLFDISWAHREKIDRSEASFYLLKPKLYARELFGFERELLLLYSPYSALEPRTLKQFEDIVSRPQLKGRTEPLYMVLVAPIGDIESEVARYRQDAEQGRIIVGFSESELAAAAAEDPWFLRRRFSKSLFSRDLFDMKQALVADNYFFGRQTLVLELLDRFKRGENTGLYGLRKTGKTSALFKLRRLLETEGAGLFVYIDAQSPEVYQRRWWELLSKIKDDTAAAAGVELPRPLDREFTERTALGRARSAFTLILSRLRKIAPRVLVVIDEVEHLHPGMSPASHWNEDFVHFWKLLRALQTEERRLAFVIAGVNAKVSESSTISDQDNPLFSLVGTRYLPPFLPNDTREMVQGLGRRMGILFDVESCQYLTTRYGGHPMLVRLACSWEHTQRTSAEYTERPVRITAPQLLATEEERERELVYYVRHVLDVLRIWYPEEYELLSLLAAGDIDEFRAYARELPESVQHLKAYGLVDKVADVLSIGMVERYLNTERAKRTSGTTESVSTSSHSPQTVTEAAALDLKQLIRSGESETLEFKSTLRVNLHTSQPDQKIEHSALKTIAAFLNSNGGHLLIGVNDEGTPIGVKKDGFASEDKMMIHLVNLIKDRLGAEHAPLISARFVKVASVRILVVECRRSARPVFVKSERDDLFFVRLLAATTELTVRQAQQYITLRFLSSSA